jgi:hypothetical protein
MWLSRDLVLPPGSANVLNQKHRMQRLDGRVLKVKLHVKAFRVVIQSMHQHRANSDNIGGHGRSLQSIRLLTLRRQLVPALSFPAIPEESKDSVCKTGARHGAGADDETRGKFCDRASCRQQLQDSHSRAACATHCRTSTAYSGSCDVLSRSLTITHAPS